MAKKTLTPEEIRQLEVYHSTLITVEQILSSSNPTSIDEIKENIEIAQNFSKQNQKRNPLTEEQYNNIKNTLKLATTLTNIFKDDPKYAQKLVTDKFKALRKPLDKEYIKNLLISTSSPQTETLAQARSFFELIKQSDPIYFDEMIATTLKYFKQLPKELNYKLNKQTTLYTMSDNDIKKIKQAKDVINQIIPGYKIDLKEHDKPKPYALAYLDRVMFNGAIHKADYADKNSNYPTSAEAIKTLEDETKENGSYAKSKTAKKIINLFKKYMEKNKLENRPFPQLINYLITSYKESQNYKGDTIHFQKVERDENGIYSYQTNKHLQDFYQQIAGEYLKASDIEAGKKYKYREQIEKDDVNLALMCDGIEQYLLHQCEQYKLSKDVIYGVFGKIKLDTNNKAKKDYHKNLYHFLTSAQIKVKVAPNKQIDTTMFTPSLHHDTSRIHSGKNPNDNIDNFILTIIPSENVSFLDIYERFIKSIETLQLNDTKINPKLLDKERTKIKELRKSPIKTLDIHKDIFHGADVNIKSQDDTSERYLQFYFTPIKDETSLHPNRIVAVINSATPISKDKKQTIKDIQENLITKTYINAQKALRRN